MAEFPDTARTAGRLNRSVAAEAAEASAAGPVAFEPAAVVVPAALAVAAAATAAVAAWTMCWKHECPGSCSCLKNFKENMLIYVPVTSATDRTYL